MPKTFRSKRGKNGKRVSYPITKPSEKYQQPFMNKYVVTMGKKPEGEEVRKTVLKEVSGYKVCSVDAEIIKKKYGLDFFFGGNGRVLKFIPVDEIWIGTKSGGSWTEDERESTIFHEIIEAELMKEGLERKEQNGGAHTLSNRLESKLREDGNWGNRLKYLRGINESKVRDTIAGKDKEEK